MKVEYSETVVNSIEFEIEENGLVGEDLEEAAREKAWELIQENGWDCENVIESNYREVKGKK